MEVPPVWLKSQILQQQPSQRQKFKQLLYRLDHREAVERFEELMGALGKRDNLPGIYELISFLSTWLQLINRPALINSNSSDSSSALKDLIMVDLGELYWKCGAAQMALGILEKVNGQKSACLRAGIHLEQGNLISALSLLLDGACVDDLLKVCGAAHNTLLLEMERFVSV